MNWSNKLIHTVARWDTTNIPDAYGKLSYNENDQILCRWMYKTTLLTNSEGKELVSNAILYTKTLINSQSYFEFDDTIIGDTNPKIRPEARLVMKIERHYSLKGNETMYKVFL